METGYKVHQGQQDKHIEGTPNYNQQVSNCKYPSILREDAQNLLDDFAGTGEKINDVKERVNFGKIIGEYYDADLGKYIPTSNSIIHYNSSGGAHIAPARP